MAAQPVDSSQYIRVGEIDRTRLAPGQVSLDLAVNTHNGTLVMLKQVKLPSPSLEPELNALTFLQTVQHENIMSTQGYWYRQDQREFVIVYPYLSASLWELWNTPHGKAGLTSTAVSLRYMRQIACGLAHLHGLDIIHDDITMQNIMVDGASGKVQVAGLHSAISARTALTYGRHPCDTVSTLGSVYTYMSPECALGSYTLTKAVDSWGLGIIMMAFIAGQFPTLEANTIDVLLDVILQILGPVDAQKGTFIQSRPLWPQVQHKLTSEVSEPLLARIHEFPIARPLGEQHLGVHLVQELLKWCPEDRLPCGDLVRKYDEFKDELEGFSDSRSCKRAKHGGDQQQVAEEEALMRKEEVAEEEAGEPEEDEMAGEAKEAGEEAEEPEEVAAAEEPEDVAEEAEGEPEVADKGEGEPEVAEEEEGEPEVAEEEGEPEVAEEEEGEPEEKQEEEEGEEEEREGEELDREEPEEADQEITADSLTRDLIGGCQCRGNCGHTLCKRRQTRHRAHKSKQGGTIPPIECTIATWGLVAMIAGLHAHTTTFCTRCKCTVCGRVRYAASMRFCYNCHLSIETEIGTVKPVTHYTSPWSWHSGKRDRKICTPMKYQRNWGWLFRLLARSSWLVPRTFPSDAVVLQELWSASVIPGQRISTCTLMWMFLEHGIKWPSACLELHAWKQGQQLDACSQLDIYIAGMVHVLRWAGGKPMNWMHQQMNGVGLMHATMGLIIFAKSLGLLAKLPKSGKAAKGSEILHLGVKQTAYALHPTAKVTRKVMQKFIDESDQAVMVWPSHASDVASFADSCYKWLKALRSIKVEGIGPQGGCDKQYQYALKHGCRLVLSTATNNIPDAFQGWSMKELLEYCPDERKHTEDLENLTCHDVQTLFGIPSLWLSCIMCLLNSVGEEIALWAMKADDGELRQPILQWEIDSEKNRVDNEDFFTPCIKYVLETAYANANAGKTVSVKKRPAAHQDP